MEELKGSNIKESDNEIIPNNHQKSKNIIPNIIPKKNKYTIKKKLGIIKESNLTSIHAILLNMELIEILFEIG